MVDAVCTPNTENAEYTVEEGETNSVSEVTRLNIVDFITVSSVEWWGRLDETGFLSRIYDLDHLPSTDSRYRTAYHDIKQHRENNWDWPLEWVFTDRRFNLRRGSDEIFLRFLCEMLHPVVQPDFENVQQLLNVFNEYLARDGWEIAPYSELSGRPLFAARRLIDVAGLGVRQARLVESKLNTAYVGQQITRMENAVVRDPELAIGTAKEFIETICKTILRARGSTTEQADELPRLVKQTVKELRLTSGDVPDSIKEAKSIRVLLSNLATIAQGIAELRNMHGSGHGKDARTGSIPSRHARLVVGAATTLGVFLFETFQDQAAVQMKNND